MDDVIKSQLAELGMLIATRVGNVCQNLDLVKEVHSERAAIREYLGGVSRERAEMYALEDTCHVLGIRYFKGS